MLSSDHQKRIEAWKQDVLALEPLQISEGARATTALSILAGNLGVKMAQEHIRGNSAEHLQVMCSLSTLVAGMVNPGASLTQEQFTYVQREINASAHLLKANNVLVKDIPLVGMDYDKVKMLVMFINTCSSVDGPPSSSGRAVEPSNELILDLGRMRLPKQPAD